MNTISTPSTRVETKAIFDKYVVNGITKLKGADFKVCMDLIQKEMIQLYLPLMSGEDRERAVKTLKMLESKLDIQRNIAIYGSV